MSRVSVSACLRSVPVLAALAMLAGIATAACAETVHFTVDAARNVTPISRYIYGINAPLSGPLANLTFRRLGGNRWTAYNWVNNASNAGSDYIFQNDDFLGGGDTPGGAVIPGIGNARNRGAGLLLTIPINGYVAADKNGDGDVRDTPDYLKTRFRKGRAVKGPPFTLNPDPADKFVYQDEFVNWVKTNYPNSQTAGTDKPIWFSLDNEPDLWAETHLAIHPDPVTYAELVKKTIAYALGIKAVAPDTMIFGPASYGWAGFVRLQDAPDANGRDFLLYYLRKMQAAETANGKRLLEVLDVHWYPEATGGGVRTTAQDTSPAVVAARLQAPRSLWDKSYREVSWIADDYLDGPINLLAWLKQKIARGYPGTKLAVTEYNYGASQHISGGIAQADVLGIFGREGVFAASQWPLYDDEPFVAGAMQMFRNFDGNGGAFGDVSIFAKTDNVADTSIYASLDSADPNRLVLVAINKTAQKIKAVIKLKNAPALNSALIFQLKGLSAKPKSAGPIVADLSRFTYAMPPFSVSTLELTNN